MGADQEANERSIGRRAFVHALDDDLHFLARAFERGGDRQPNAAIELDRMEFGRYIRG
ncbi:MAG TPA: hypothetical protein VME69_13450 [Methylocella sp.]|nr:hypothetical protein [Methylocella sp.]